MDTKNTADLDMDLAGKEVDSSCSTDSLEEGKYNIKRKLAISPVS